MKLHLQLSSSCVRNFDCFTTLQSSGNSFSVLGRVILEKKTHLIFIERIRYSNMSSFYIFSREALCLVLCNSPGIALHSFFFSYRRSEFQVSNSIRQDF